MTAHAEPWMGDLEDHLSVAATLVAGRLRKRRRSRQVAALAIAATLVVGGAALAQTTPFHPIASFQNLIGAQRATTPNDALPPALRKRFASMNVSGIHLDQFRLMARRPDGKRIYAAPRDDGSLCLIVALGASGGAVGCGPKLGRTVPLTAIIATGFAGAGAVLAGLARDDVRAVVITAQGVPVRIPVSNNAFFYVGAPFTGLENHFIAELRDGSAVAYPR
jgi:hypothetical protein